MSALLLVLPLLVPVGTPRVQGGEPPASPSLERWLARLRTEREASLRRLRERVTTLLGQFDVLVERDRRREAPALRGELVSLGPEAGPLLVDALDPGEEPTPESVFRAEQVARTLEELVSPSVTDDLLRLAREGSVEGRVHALEVLACSSEAARVLPVVESIFCSAEGPVRSAALAAAARLGGAQQLELFGEVLLSGDTELVDVTLRAFGAAGNADVAGRVLDLVRSPAAAEHLPALLEYYAAVPAAFSEPHRVALLELAGGDELRWHDKVALLEALRTHDIELGRAEKRLLEPLAGSPLGDLSEAARVLLAIHGDRNARRDLLKPYDREVQRNGDSVEALTARARVCYRIRDYGAAIKDYKRALRELGNRNVDPEPFLGLARCYALLGRFREAVDYLDTAPVSRQTLRELADDPDFAEMRADPRYIGAFHLEE